MFGPRKGGSKDVSKIRGVCCPRRCWSVLLATPRNSWKRCWEFFSCWKRFEMILWIQSNRNFWCNFSWYPWQPWLNSERHNWDWWDTHTGNKRMVIEYENFAPACTRFVTFLNWQNVAKDIDHRSFFGEAYHEKLRLPGAQWGLKEMNLEPHDIVEDLDVSKNRGTSKWMVYNGKPY